MLPRSWISGRFSKLTHIVYGLRQCSSCSSPLRSVFRFDVLCAGSYGEQSLAGGDLNKHTFFSPPSERLNPFVYSQRTRVSRHEGINPFSVHAFIRHEQKANRHVFPDVPRSVAVTIDCFSLAVLLGFRQKIRKTSTARNFAAGGGCQRCSRRSWVAQHHEDRHHRHHHPGSFAGGVQREQDPQVATLGALFVCSGPFIRRSYWRRSW